MFVFAPEPPGNNINKDLPLQVAEPSEHSASSSETSSAWSGSSTSHADLDLFATSAHKSLEDARPAKTESVSPFGLSLAATDKLTSSPQILLSDRPRYTPRRHAPAKIQRTANDADVTPSKLRKVILDRQTLDDGSIVYKLGTRFGGVVTRDDGEVSLHDIDNFVSNEELQRFENQNFQQELRVESVKKPLGRPRKFPDPLAGDFVTSGSSTPQPHRLNSPKPRGRPRKGLIAAATSDAGPPNVKGPRGRPKKVLPPNDQPTGRSILVEIPSSIKARVEAVRSSVPPFRSETPVSKDQTALREDESLDKLDSGGAIESQSRFNKTVEPNSSMPSLVRKDSRITNGPVMGTFLMSPRPSVTIPKTSQLSSRSTNLTHQSSVQVPRSQQKTPASLSRLPIVTLSSQPLEQSSLAFRSDRHKPEMDVEQSSQNNHGQDAQMNHDASAHEFETPRSLDHRNSKDGSQLQHEKSRAEDQGSVTLLRHFEAAVRNSTRPLHTTPEKLSIRRHNPQGFQMAKDAVTDNPAKSSAVNHNHQSETSRRHNKKSDVEGEDAVPLLRRFEAPVRSLSRPNPHRPGKASSQYGGLQDVEMIDLTSAEDVRTSLPAKHKYPEESFHPPKRGFSAEEDDAQSLLRRFNPSNHRSHHLSTQSIEQQFTQPQSRQAVPIPHPTCLPPSQNQKSSELSTDPETHVVNLEEEEEDAVSLLQQFQPRHFHPLPKPKTQNKPAPSPIPYAHTQSHTHSFLLQTTPPPHKPASFPSSPKSSARKSMTPHYPPLHRTRKITIDDFFAPKHQLQPGLEVGERLEGEGQVEVMGRKRKRKRGGERDEREMDETMEEVGAGREESIEL